MSSLVSDFSSSAALSSWLQLRGIRGFVSAECEQLLSRYSDSRTALAIHASNQGAASIAACLVRLFTPVENRLFAPLVSPACSAFAA
jgi:hypothetical protein